jgi:hypothetical protein
VSGSFVTTAHEAWCRRSGSFGNREARVRWDGEFGRAHGFEGLLRVSGSFGRRRLGSFRFYDGPWFVLEAPFLILPICERR